MLAHNFIEGGLDLNLVQHQPEILALYRSAIKISYSFEIIKCLAGYFAVPAETVSWALHQLNRMIGSANFSSLSVLARDTVVPLIKIRLKKEVDVTATQALLAKGVAITADSYLGFLDRVVDDMRRDFARYLPQQKA